ncbi:MAG: helix-turn-helix domain-containing protein [Defluviitaleaceae bacterium]|nr:helix-turn-helix domain-containing protein [Defluviitaleaceae bacterium]
MSEPTKEKPKGYAKEHVGIDKFQIGETIRKIRESKGLTQDMLANTLRISRYTLSGMENGTRKTTLWEFMSIAEMVGIPEDIDSWALLLNSDVFEDYMTFQKLKTLLRASRYDEAKVIIADFEEKINSSNPHVFIRQYIEYAKVLSNWEIPPDEAIRKLEKTMRITREKYKSGDIPRHRLTYNEARIFMGMAVHRARLGDNDAAIKLYKAIVDKRKNGLISEKDNAVLFTCAIANLSALLGKQGRYEEALNYCEMALNICMEYSCFRYVAKTTYNMAYIHLDSGSDEKIYKDYFLRAHYTALSIGDKETLKNTRRNAEKFGVSLQIRV